MPLQNHILDNKTSAVADYQLDNLCGTDAFNFTSAYFGVYGYELLADALGKIAGVRFLFGDPTSVDDLASSANEPKSFKFLERVVEPNHALPQRPWPTDAPSV